VGRIIEFANVEQTCDPIREAAAAFAKNLCSYLCLRSKHLAPEWEIRNFDLPVREIPCLIVSTIYG
jgi:hypothetical protein